MGRFEPGLTFSPSPQAVEIVRERLHRAGLPITEAAARSLLDAVLAVEGPRMQAIARGILHGSLETIRQTAEVALSTLREEREPPDLIGAVKQHIGGEPEQVQRHREGGEVRNVGPGARRPVAARRPPEEVEDDQSSGIDPRPVFKRRGR